MFELYLKVRMRSHDRRALDQGRNLAIRTADRNVSWYEQERLDLGAMLESLLVVRGPRYAVRLECRHASKHHHQSQLGSNLLDHR